MSLRCHTSDRRKVLIYRRLREKRWGAMIETLILCTANSARSILAEAILGRLGEGRFRAHSAGSHPRGTVNPRALELLANLGYQTEQYASKSWDEFAGPDAPKLNLVITVCDAAAGEACPLWRDAPVVAHWGIPDPAGAPGGIEAERAAFKLAYDRLHARFAALVALPVETLSTHELKEHLKRIGASDGATELTRQSQL